MGSFEKGEIVLVPFPFTDLSSTKIRPCLILSNQLRDDIILCQITSKQARDEYCIELTSTETLVGSLSIDSFIRCNMIFTASNSMIHKKLCRLSTRKYNEVVNKIIEIIRR